MDEYAQNDEYSVEEVNSHHPSMRRFQLYGCGPRSTIPKVKRDTQVESSPFQLHPTPSITGHRTDINSQVPPGAHQDIYRIVQYPTTKSKNDPDRIFFTTTRYTEGVQAIEQPPWYYGNNNKTKPADTSMTKAASRYGFRGSSGIQQFHVNPVEPPANTRNPYTPKFLDGNDATNEWVPPILATKFQTINNLESPKLWPQNTEYVTGYKKKKLPRSVSYNRETTVAMKKKDRPKSTARLRAVFDKSITEINTLNDFSKMEGFKTCSSLPILAQDTFNSTWNDRVSTAGTQSLRITMNTEHKHQEPHTLIDTSDEMRYSGSTALIVHSQTNEELKFRFSMEKNKNSIPYQLRWKQVEFSFRGIKAKLKRDQNMFWAIKEIAESLRRAAIHHGAPTSLRRSEFVECMMRIPQMEGCSAKQCSLIYSAFDARKKNVMRFVEYIVSLAVLDEPLSSVKDILGKLWQLYNDFGSDMPTFDIAKSILCVCANSDSDRLAMEALFKTQFRPSCYRMSVMESMDLMDKLDADASQVFLEATKGLSFLDKIRKKKDLSVQPQFNICDNYLDQFSFLRVLDNCSEILELFEKQWICRLTHFYGNNPKEPPSIETEM